MIEIKNIFKSFGNVEVLHDVSLSVQKGEIVSIIGASGAGKTTLLQIIGTLLKPDKGKIFIDGTDISLLNDKQIAGFRNEHIGFIFQFHQLLPEFSALENVAIPALLGSKRYSQREAYDLAKTLLIRLGLQTRLDHKPSELSGGERQRVAAARALIMKPDVILADEPSGSLDSQNKMQLNQLLRKLRDDFGQTIIIVTHDNELAAICDRVIEMKDGKIIL